MTESTDHATMTTQEIARMCSVTDRTVSRWGESGRHGFPQPCGHTTAHAAGGWQMIWRRARVMDWWASVGQVVPKREAPRAALTAGRALCRLDALVRARKQGPGHWFGGAA